MTDHDLIIRSGLIVDGNGGEPFEGDVAVDGGVIAAVGAVSGRGDQRDRCRRGRHRAGLRRCAHSL